jgi:hypothetical protein
MFARKRAPGKVESNKHALQPAWFRGEFVVLAGVEGYVAVF